MMPYFIERYRKPITALLAGLFLLCISSCQKHSEIDTQTDSNADQEIVPKSIIYKPGPPISFSTNYDGSSEVNVLETFEIELVAHSAGVLRVTTISEENIIVEDFSGNLSGGDMPLTKEVISGEALTFPISIQLQRSGKFYINVLAELETNGTTQTTVFSVAIQTPPNNTQFTKSVSQLQEKPKIIVMPAEENIRSE